jgi:7-cyano-7-deazaguanine synthase
LKVLVVLSGGMDSSTALAWAMQNHDVVGALQFWYGSKHNYQEREHAIKVARFYGVPLQMCDLSFVAHAFKSDLLKTGGDIPEGHYADPSMKRTVVPFRNGIMLSIAAGLAESMEAQAIVLGNHFGDHAVYPDCRKSFIEPMKAAIAEGTYAKIELLSPFCEVDKTEIVRIGRKIGVPYELTYSCYKGGEKHCGKCGTCFERKEAFTLAGVDDPTVYEQ